MQSPDTHVEISREGGVQTIRLTRPEKKNAVTEQMYGAIADALTTGDADPGVGAHLFCGSAGVFSAGQDLSAFLEPGSGVPPQLDRFLDAQVLARKPMVAAVDGLAIGIGTTLLLQCDMVFCSPGAVFRTPFTDLGGVPENASSLIAPQIMGPLWAFELLCLGETFDAERALAARLVNAVLPVEELEPHARAVAARLAAKPPRALEAARALVRGSVEERLAVSRRERQLFFERIRSEEARAALAAAFGSPRRN
ncbi:enoyl-CoA hydratase [Paroceanicella profunda]|uniref:Enoyl-CoA hydratase n=1 Tax=Paroceanicella profunda TaxID=2579971 RepID=A0A5B8FGB1_9RHOB|nr:enoyl-CoA hydratase-related protein [Paroceanicella profunda]QDL90628.1 enoyl-CoA hydratase [Paroceanicella profunda]